MGWAIAGSFTYLLLASTVGMTLLASAADLIMLYLSLETVAIPLYVLAGFYCTATVRSKLVLSTCCSERCHLQSCCMDLLCCLVSPAQPTCTKLSQRIHAKHCEWCGFELAIDRHAGFDPGGL